MRPCWGAKEKKDKPCESVGLGGCPLGFRRRGRVQGSASGPEGVPAKYYTLKLHRRPLLLALHHHFTASSARGSARKSASIRLHRNVSNSNTPRTPQLTIVRDPYMSSRAHEDKRGRTRSRSRSRDRYKDRDARRDVRDGDRYQDRRRDREGDSDRRRSRSRSRSKSPPRRRRSESTSRRRSRSLDNAGRSRKRSRSRSPDYDRHKHRERSREKRRRSRSRSRSSSVSASSDSDSEYEKRKKRKDKHKKKRSRSRERSKKEKKKDKKKKVCALDAILKYLLFSDLPPTETEKCCLQSSLGKIWDYQ